MIKIIEEEDAAKEISIIILNKFIDIIFIILKKL